MGTRISDLMSTSLDQAYWLWLNHELFCDRCGVEFRYPENPQVWFDANHQAFCKDCVAAIRSEEQ